MSSRTEAGSPADQMLDAVGGALASPWEMGRIRTGRIEQRRIFQVQE